MYYFFSFLKHGQGSEQQHFASPAHSPDMLLRERAHNVGDASSPSPMKASLGSLWGLTMPNPLLRQPDSKCLMQFREQYQQDSLNDKIILS